MKIYFIKFSKMIFFFLRQKSNILRGTLDPTTMYVPVGGFQLSTRSPNIMPLPAVVDRIWWALALPLSNSFKPGTL